MTKHRYQRGAIAGDYARGGIGLAVTGLPLVATPLATTMTVIFGGLATLFGVYIVRTWMRSVQAIELDGEGIRRTGPISAAIRWDDLTAFEVRYFSTRKEKNAGWMELKLGGDGSKLAIESSLDDFEVVARHCTLVARRNGLELSPTTQDNLRALGLLGPAEDANEPENGPANGSADGPVGGPGAGSPGGA